MENEDVMRINDVKRRSFNKGWKAAVKKAEKWLSKHAKEYVRTTKKGRVRYGR